LRRAGLGKPRRGFVCATAILAAVAALATAGACSLALAATGGMVRYDHPVYHNGKLVLWHGAWRGSAGRRPYARTARARAPTAEAAAPRTPAPEPAAEAPAAAESAAGAATLKPFAVLADPGDQVASRMAREFIEVLNEQGAQGRAIVGSSAPTGVAKVMRTDMADFAVVTLDSLAVSVKYQPDWPKRVPLVAALAPETIEVIAPKEIKSVGDLAEKSVSFGDPDGTTGISAKLLFSRLGVTVDPTYEPLQEALSALADGKRDAVVVLGGREAHALDGFGDDKRFHVVAIPWSAALEQVYTPARVAASDRPNLVPAHDSVETVAEPMALVALDATAGAPRADALGRIARTFFDNYQSTLTAAHDEHWRDVNLAAGVTVANADWPRLPAAQGWIDEHKTSANDSLEAFRAAAKSAEASGGPKAEDSDRLYDSLTRWRSLMQ
jgi:TRAP-type uncharacterized transport system substrate-binding protein